MGVAVLPPLRPNARNLILDINFGCIQYRHSLSVRLHDPYASYFACGLSSNTALLHLTWLVWSQGLEMHIVEGEPESERIFCGCTHGLVCGWGGLLPHTNPLPAGG